MTQIKRASKTDLMNSFYKKYGLSKESDIHEQLGRSNKVMFRIITRGGIEKIMTKLGITIDYELISPDLVPAKWIPIYDKNGKCVSVKPMMQIVIKATGTIVTEDGTRVLSSFGEASEENTKQNYPFAIAEKRGMGRVVLKMAGMYEYGFFSEDENDEWGKAVKHKSRVKTEAPTESSACDATEADIH